MAAPQKPSSVGSRAMTMLPALSAVDGQHGAGDRGGVVRRQAGDGAGDVLWLDDAPQRIPAFERRDHFRVLLRSLGPDRRATVPGSTAFTRTP
jgi:hypothetical protein